MEADHGANLLHGGDQSASMLAVTAPAAFVGNDTTRPGWRWWPVYTIVAAGVALGSFFAYSQIRSPIAFGYFSHPPIYGIWNPQLSQLAMLVIPAGLMLAAAAWATTSSRRLPTWLVIVLIVICAVATAASIALVRGQWHDLFRGVSTAANVPYDTADIHFVSELGVRGFVERHPELTAEFHSYHSKTHPPGGHLILFVLFRLFGAAHPLRIATVLAVLSMCAAEAAWLAGRTLGGERAGRIAAVLVVGAPGPLLLAYTSMDAIYATLLATAAALFMLAIHRQSPLVAGVAGAVLAIGTLTTFATVFIAVAATVAIIVQASTVGSALRQLGAAAAGGLATLLLAWLALGFDVLASYQAVPKAGRAYDPYWILASPAAWLIWSGLPLAALGVAGLIMRVPGARRPMLPIALVVVMVIWGALPAEITSLRPGEVERTWAFLYPVLAAAAGPVVDRWTRGAGRWSGAIVAGLVVISVAQTVLLQALWDNLF